MTRSFGLLAASALVLLTACGGSGSTAGSGGHGGAGAGASSSSTGKDTGGGPPATSSSTGTGGSGAPSAADLLAVLGTCDPASNGKYKTDSDSANATVEICKLNGAFYWQADMDVDCDGKTTTQCNINTDPAYQDQTSTTDSNGDPLDAANLPYVVIPLPSSTFDYMASGFELGDVVAVVYNGQVNYGVFGDEGPDDIIGEASYAMAKSLGIDPDPSTGGTDSGVTYIAFPGSGAVVDPIEDHQKAVTLGEMLAKQLIVDN